MDLHVNCSLMRSTLPLPLPCACRLVEIGLAADAWKTASNTNRDFNNLRYWVDSGYDYWGGLEQLLAPIITQHQARLAREEAERQRQELQQRLDDRWAQGAACNASGLCWRQFPIVGMLPCLPAPFLAACPPAAWPPRG